MENYHQPFIPYVRICGAVLFFELKITNNLGNHEMKEKYLDFKYLSERKILCPAFYIRKA